MSKQATTPDEPERQESDPYHPPTLTEYGTLVELTQQTQQACVPEAGFFDFGNRPDCGGGRS